MEAPPPRHPAADEIGLRCTVATAPFVPGPRAPTLTREPILWNYTLLCSENRRTGLQRGYKSRSDAISSAISTAATP